MAFIPVPNTIKVVLEFLVGGQLVVVTIHVQKATAVTDADLTLAASRAVDWWQTYVKPLQAAAVSLTRAVAYDLTTAAGHVVNYTTGLPQSGTQTGDALPNNVAAVLSFRSANRGRSGRGRMYLFGLSENGTADPVSMNGANQSALLTAAIGLTSYYTAIGLTHVIVSRFTNGAPRAQGLAQPVINWVVDALWDSQRRRLSGRGI